MSVNELPALVNAEWLASTLPEGDIITIDTTVLSVARSGGGVEWRSGRESFEHEHIPGSRFADLLEAFSSPDAQLVFTRPDSHGFQTAARALGIGPDSRVVLYDNAINAFSARLWWLFRSFGHDRVAVLDGGLQAWKAAGHALESGLAAPVDAGIFVAEPRDGFFVERADVLAVVNGELRGTLVCALPPENPEVDSGFRGRPGRIPGSVSVPAADMLSPQTGTLALTTQFDELADQDEPVITYCGGGISASLDAFALTLLGYRNVRVYDGSLNEWVLDVNAPLVVGL